ncbi:hypothetical protein [Nocardioides dongkuii]|uniref:hypothetical protein n=1 Tax=Nocardioides dongkuii TaxID=2760089 RepID=UPI0015F8E560|nr:hypothetical protein [Nocardioides dongkuii]
MKTWPAAGEEVWSELSAVPGRVALLVDDPESTLALRFAELRHTTPLHVGRVLSGSLTVPTERQIRSILRDAPVLVGTAILFDPVLGLDAARLFQALARQEPGRVIEWPVATTSSPFRWPGDDGSRPVSPALESSLLLTARTTVFDDEVPFTLERLRR